MGRRKGGARMGCPHCKGKSIRFLSGASDGALVDYYRCETCGCVWNCDKSNPGGTVRIINFEPVKMVTAGGYRRLATKRTAS